MDFRCLRTCRARKTIATVHAVMWIESAVDVHVPAVGYRESVFNVFFPAVKRHDSVASSRILAVSRQECTPSVLSGKYGLNFAEQSLLLVVALRRAQGGPLQPRSPKGRPKAARRAATRRAGENCSYFSDRTLDMLPLCSCLALKRRSSRAVRLASVSHSPNSWRKKARG